MIQYYNAIEKSGVESADTRVDGNMPLKNTKPASTQMLLVTTMI